MEERKQLSPFYSSIQSTFVSLREKRENAFCKKVSTTLNFRAAAAFTDGKVRSGRDGRKTLFFSPEVRDV